MKAIHEQRAKQTAGRDRLFLQMRPRADRYRFLAGAQTAFQLSEVFEFGCTIGVHKQDQLTTGRQDA